MKNKDATSRAIWTWQRYYPNSDFKIIFLNTFLYKVPGDFHLSYHAHRDLVDQLDKDFKNKLDLKHEIKHLSFSVID